MEKIKSWSCVETSMINKYFYERNLKRYQLCHPLLIYLIELNNRMDVKKWFSSINSDYVTIGNYGCFSKKEIEYYVQKFFLLKENGYFTEINQMERLSSRLNGDAIESSLANVNRIVFEVTDRCNLNCKYCCYGNFYSNFDKRKGIKLDFARAKIFLDYMQQLWNSPLNISHNKTIFISFYGGEPLLNFEFVKKVVAYANQLNARKNRFSFAMTTNGTLLQKYIDFLYQNDFNLLISLDGNEQNNEYRLFKNGKETFKTIIKNVSFLQKNYPDYFKKRVNFLSVIHNKNSISEVYHFFKNYFNKKPNINGLCTIGIDESKKKEFWKIFANKNHSLHENEDYSVIEKELFFRLPNIEDVIKFLFYSNEFCSENYNQLIYNTENSKRVPTGTCFPFSLKIFLTVYGKILPCERIGQQFALGKVLSDGLELDFEKIADKYNRYYDNMRDKCFICHNAEICTQCVFNLNSIEDNVPICNGFMDEKDYAKYLSHFVNYFEKNPESFLKILRGRNHE